MHLRVEDVRSFFKKAGKMSTLERQTWLASLKPGDQVAVEYDYDPEYGYNYVIKTVHDVNTSGGIQLTDGRQYRASDGTEDAISIWSLEGWGDPCYKLVEITPMIEKAIRRKELLMRIKQINWERVTVGALEQVVQALSTWFDE